MSKARSRGRGKDRAPAVAAIVLAAGASTRMGSPKLLLPVAGEPLLARALRAVTGAGLAEVVVVLGADADLVRRTLTLDGVRVVVNPRYREGMSTSIQVGLRATDPSMDAYLIVLGDEPFVSPETMKSLVRSWKPDGAFALIPTFRGRRGHPILVDRRLAPRIDAVSGDTGYRTLFRSDDVLEVPVEDPGILLDIDEPGDLEEVSRGLDSGGALVDIVTALMLRRKDRLG